MIGKVSFNAFVVSFAISAVSVHATDDVVRLSVPYVKQTRALCGGAAAAMMLRFWGDREATAQQFASLVDRGAGGISNAVLTSAIEQRGWNAVQFHGSIESVEDRLRDGQPVIVLTHERGERYHYVVVVGFTNEHVVLHDPARGPSRMMKIDVFSRAWTAAGSWALLVLPNAGSS